MGLFNLDYGLGRCAKQTVTCTIVAPNGKRFIGRNWCFTPQPICPRLPGEGYEKCKKVCHQIGHAEDTALIQARGEAKGAAAYIEGHTRVCHDCQTLLNNAGVSAVVLGKPPKVSA